MKCEICSKRIRENFLRKIMGAYIKDKDGKKHAICFECQKRFKTKDAILNEFKK